MAVRRKGTLDLQENIETGKQMPLDARQLVRSKEEMLTEGSFDYGYKGLFTAERTEGKLWMLMDHNNPTLEESWKVIGPYDDSALDARVTALENASPGEQVQANWNETDTTSKAYIQNKPSLASVATSGDFNDLINRPVVPPAYDDTELRGMIAVKANSADLATVATSGSYNDLTDQPTIPPAYDDSALDARVTALENASPTEQVQADWEESDTTSKAYIQNKPTIPEAYDDTAIRAALAGKVDASSLANVATSGSYNDLGDKPTIPEAYDDSALAARIAAVETTLPNKANSADLANVATSGSYNDLGDKPTIPEAYDDTALAGRVSALEAKTETQADWNETDTESAAYIANKPTIPEAYDDTVLAGRVTAVETALPSKADSSSLATVATSGSYNDLTDQPTIPEAYDDTALSARVTALEGRTDADTQADWNETDTTSPAYIQNKPTIPTPITIDAAMDAASENPVQNKVVLAAIGDAVDVVDTAVQGLDTRVTALETDKVTVTAASISGGGGGEEVTVSVQEANDQTGEKVLGVRYFTDDQGAVSGDPTLIVGSQNFSLQRELVSGTNIKTINGQQILGSGNLILHQGVGDGLDLNNMPSYNELSQMLSDNALLYIDGNWLVTGLMIEGSTAQVIGTYADSARYYVFDTNDNPDAPLAYSGTYNEGSSSKPNMVVSAGGSQPYGRFQRGDGQEFLLFGLANGISITFTDQQGRVQNRNYTITPSYIVDNPEGSDAQLGNVVQVGTLQDTDGTEVGIFEFYYRSSALPNATSAEYTLLPLLNEYNIVDFLDATGVTSNGHLISNGRIDGTNYVIVQQFSKNRKAVILRSYQDFSAQTALLKIKFLGTKTTA